MRSETLRCKTVAISASSSQFCCFKAATATTTADWTWRSCPTTSPSWLRTDRVLEFDLPATIVLLHSPPYRPAAGRCACVIGLNCVTLVRRVNTNVMMTGRAGVVALHLCCSAPSPVAQWNSYDRKARKTGKQRFCRTPARGDRRLWKRERPGEGDRTLRGRRTKMASGRVGAE